MPGHQLDCVMWKHSKTICQMDFVISSKTESTHSCMRPPSDPWCFLCHEFIHRKCNGTKAIRTGQRPSLTDSRHQELLHIPQDVLLPCYPWYPWTAADQPLFQNILNTIKWLGGSDPETLGYPYHIPFLFPIQWGAKELFGVSQPSIILRFSKHPHKRSPKGYVSVRKPWKRTNNTISILIHWPSTQATNNFQCHLSLMPVLDELLFLIRRRSCCSALNSVSGKCTSSCGQSRIQHTSPSYLIPLLRGSSHLATLTRLL